MRTLIDPFELQATTPPMRAPMATMSVDIDFEGEAAAYRPASDAVLTTSAPESWGRVRCWCSED